MSEVDEIYKFMKNENLKLKLKNLKNELEKAIEYLEKELQSCPIEHKIELEEFRRKRGIAITKFFENGGTLEGLPNFIDKRKKFRGKIYEKRRQI